MNVNDTSPEDWSEAATRGDLAMVKGDLVLLRRDIEAAELRFEAKLANALRTHTFAILGGVAVINTLTLATSRLL